MSKYGRTLFLEWEIARTETLGSEWQAGRVTSISIGREPTVEQERQRGDARESSKF